MNLFKNLPDEILVTLFCYLDKESKQIAAEVCRHWRILIHDMSWKHITRLVEGDITMTADFSNFVVSLHRFLGQKLAISMTRALSFFLWFLYDCRLIAGFIL